MRLHVLALVLVRVKCRVTAFTQISDGMHQLTEGSFASAQSMPPCAREGFISAATNPDVGLSLQHRGVDRVDGRAQPAPARMCRMTEALPDATHLVQLLLPLN